MVACRGRVCLSPVSLQTSTSCRHGTDQMWFARHLARVTAHVRRTITPALLSANATILITSTFLNTDEDDV